MNKDSKIYVAGHRGMVGSAIMRKLKSKGFNNIVYDDRKHLDLTDQTSVRTFFWEEKPEYVFLAAAKVGGIKYNAAVPGDFMYENLMIQTNVINECKNHNVKKLCFLGSACIYPKVTKMPIKEDYLLTGPLEPSNEPYAIAKIAGLKMCQYYRRQYNLKSVIAMPANLYGPNDNFKVEQGHVIPGLIKKFVDAEKNNIDTVEVWGDGSATREFLHVDDLADAVVYLMRNKLDTYDFLNIGSDFEISIKELAHLIKELTNYKGNIKWLTDMPNGTPKRVMNNLQLFGLGWRPKINFVEGLFETIKWYKDDSNI